MKLSAELGYTTKRSMKAYPRTTAITHTRHLHTDGANACLDLALWKRAVSYDRLPSLGIVPLSIPCQEHSDFDLERLRSKPLGALT